MSLTGVSLSHKPQRINLWLVGYLSITMMPIPRAVDGGVEVEFEEVEFVKIESQMAKSKSHNFSLSPTGLRLALLTSKAKVLIL